MDNLNVLTSEKELSLGDLAALSYRHALLLALFCAAGLISAFVLTISQPPTYTSNATLLINELYVDTAEAAHLLEIAGRGITVSRRDGGVATIQARGETASLTGSALGHAIELTRSRIRSGLPDYAQHLALLEELQAANLQLLGSATTPDGAALLSAEMAEIRSEIRALKFAIAEATTLITVVAGPTDVLRAPTPWQRNLLLGGGAGFVVGCFVIYLLSHPEMLRRKEATR